MKNIFFFYFFHLRCDICPSCSGLLYDYLRVYIYSSTTKLIAFSFIDQTLYQRAFIFFSSSSSFIVHRACEHQNEQYKKCTRNISIHCKCSELNKIVCRPPSRPPLAARGIRTTTTQHHSYWLSLQSSYMIYKPPVDIWFEFMNICLPVIFGCFCAMKVNLFSL